LVDIFSEPWVDFSTAKQRKWVKPAEDAVEHFEGEKGKFV